MVETKTLVQLRWSSVDRLEDQSPSTWQILLVDVTLTEDHELAAQLTDSPVEVGADMTDHRRVAPASLSMRGLIAEQKVEPIDSKQFAGFDFKTPDDVRDGVKLAMDTVVITKPKDAYAVLEDLFRQARLLTVTTDLWEYWDMAITSLRVHRDAATGRALIFDATFREVVLAETQLVTLGPEKTKEKGAQTSKNLGQKPAAPADPAVKESFGESQAGDFTGSMLDVVEGLND